MKNIRFLLCLLVVVCASMLVFTACGQGADTTAETPAVTTTATTTTVATTTSIDYSEKTLTPAAAIAEDQLKVYGRYVELEGEAISCDFTACGIEFSAYCRGDVAVEIQVQQPVTGQGATFGFFTIWVDGERMDVELRKDSGRPTAYTSGVRVVRTATVNLATGLEEGLHTFKILKQNNPRNCIAQINWIKLEGEMAARPADRDVLIEFIGDSLTAAYGNLGTNGVSTDNGSANIEDGTLSYAYLAAEQLGADWSIIARPGIGVIFGTDANEFQMSNIYKLQCFWRSKTVLYEPAERKPQLVVMYLGTNDNSKVGQSTANKELFDEKYRSLIDEVIANYGEDVEILLLENKALSATTKGVIASIKGDYEQVKVLPFTRHTSGAGSHASVAECQTEANELEAAIRTLYPELFPAK